MPVLKFSSVLSFTSEDPNHPADNLLSLQTFRKWKIAQNECGKPASVTLKLERLSTISSLDIGNDGSAFVEVLVARDDDNFQVLLPTSSFMSPLEARNGSDTNRVRMFTSRHLNKNIAAQKWTRVKFVCSQPFNKHSPFGLTFVALTSDEQTTAQKDDEAEKKKADILKADFAGDETTSAPNISIGSFFAKRRKMDSPENEINEQSTGSSQRGGGTSSAAVNSSAVSGSKATDARGSVPKPKAKQEARPVDRAAGGRPSQRPSTPSSGTASPAPHSSANGSSSKPSGSVHKKPTSRPKEAAATARAGVAAGPTKARNSVMQGVVYTMSGYQNPQRSQLRDKMTAMGASYRPDWTDDCTHLICAFCNTPKFRAVKGKGRIVSNRWIEESHLFKKKMPWKKYALEQNVDYWPDSPEAASGAGTNVDNCSEDLRLGTRQAKGGDDEDSEQQELQQQDDQESCNYEDDTDNEDTDDELQRRVKPRLGEKSVTEPDHRSSISPSSPTEPAHPHDRSPAVGEEAAGSDAYLTDTDEDSPSTNHRKMDLSQLKLITLPDLFLGDCFFLHRSCENSDSLHRYIVAFNGSVSDYMNDSVKFVVAEADWDQSFHEASREHATLRFVKPSWIWRCVDGSRRVPLEPHVIAPA